MDATQQGLATAVNSYTGGNWLKTTVSKVEAGRRGLSLEEAIAVSGYLHISVQEIMNTYVPRTATEMWDECTRRFSRISDAGFSMIEDLGALHLLLEELQHEIKNGDPIMPRTIDRATIAKGVGEMMNFTDRAIRALETVSGNAHWYGNLASLSSHDYNLSTWENIKKHEEEVFAQLDLRIKELERRDS